MSGLSGSVPDLNFYRAGSREPSRKFIPYVHSITGMEFFFNYVCHRLGHLRSAASDNVVKNGGKWADFFIRLQLCRQQFRFRDKAARMASWCFVCCIFHSISIPFSCVIQLQEQKKLRKVRKWWLCVSPPCLFCFSNVAPRTNPQDLRTLSRFSKRAEISHMNTTQPGQPGSC